MPVYTADKLGRTDGSAYSFLQQINCGIPIVLVSWLDGFKFNDLLYSIGDYVLVDFVEYGWDCELKDTHVFGVNTAGFGDKFNSEEWKKFDDFVFNNPPKITLKRELLKKDVSNVLQPIEYPRLVGEYPLQSKEEFNSRPVSVFQYWGRSNENRLRIHGEIWQHATQKGFSVCDNLFYIDGFLANESGEKWISLWIPHYYRVDINGLMQVNNLSKLSLSWAGAGFKCFRHSESPVNSVMVMLKNDYAWSFDWNESNCILVDSRNELAGIDAALSKSELYGIYVTGVKNAENYMLHNYIPFLENKIKSVL